MSKRPNFLFIITDQQRADYLGCMGHPVLRTPNIDSLAARGMLFDEFHTASPVCMPNRASIITGRYPSTHGLRKNGLHLPLHNSTFVEALRLEGYHTAMIGKSHLQPFTGRDIPQQNPAAKARIPDAHQDSPDDWTQEEPARWMGQAPYRVDLPYYGFEQVSIVTQHGNNCGGHYYQWLCEQVEDPTALRGPGNQLPHDYICPQAFRTAVPESLHPTSYIAQQARGYLEQRAGEEAPFFAFVSFPDPHHPFAPPGTYWGRHNPDDFEVPIPYNKHQNPPPHLQYVAAQYQDGQRNTATEKAFMASEREIREAMALTCDMISMIDDAVGSLLDTLKTTGLDDNTVIIFTSDHGDYMGDFNLLLKGPAPMRSITRVPMIWAEPGPRAPQRTSALASAIDFAPSILERAAITPYHGIQGSSLLPLLRGETWFRKSLLIEHEDNIAHWGFDAPAHSRTLLHDGYRLTLYQGQEWGELYGLGDDPHEYRNLWDDPEHRELRFELTERLLRQVIAADDRSPWPKRLA
jgi:arylsulfatase A-like enzyme